MNPFDSADVEQMKAEILARLINESVISADDYARAVELGGEAAEKVKDYVELASGDYASEENTFRCQCCDKLYHNEDESGESIYVRSRSSWYGGATEEWCSDCVSENSFGDDWSGDQFSHTHYTRVETGSGDTVCLEAHDLYLWDDGYYYDEPQPDPHQVPEYHSQDRDWEIPTTTEETIGVELETYCPEAGICYANRPAGMLGERDGSLDDEHGVEFIGPPMIFSQYANGEMWKPHLEMLRSKGASSWHASDEYSQYGMHISVGRQNLNNDHAMRFVLLINCNQRMSEKIAGRRSSRWAEYNKKDEGDAHSAVHHRDGGDKYSATNVTRQRIEVRIFRGTLDWSGFMRNVEYVQAALDFTRNSDIMACVTQDSFLSWLDETANKEKFSNLHAHLVRKGFINNGEEQDAVEESIAA
jgi:hypothetical protein